MPPPTSDTYPPGSVSLIAPPAAAGVPVVDVTATEDLLRDHARALRIAALRLQNHDCNESRHGIQSQAYSTATLLDNLRHTLEGLG